MQKEFIDSFEYRQSSINLSNLKIDVFEKYRIKEISQIIKFRVGNV